MSSKAKVAPSTTTTQSSLEKERDSKKESKLAAYQVDKKIGKGQFSCVYRATRVADGSIVALKKVPV